MFIYILSLVLASNDITDTLHCKVLIHPYVRLSCAEIDYWVVGFVESNIPEFDYSQTGKTLGDLVLDLIDRAKVICPWINMEVTYNGVTFYYDGIAGLVHIMDGGDGFYYVVEPRNMTACKMPPPDNVEDGGNIILA